MISYRPTDGKLTDEIINKYLIDLNVIDENGNINDYHEDNFLIYNEKYAFPEIYPNVFKSLITLADNILNKTNYIADLSQLEIITNFFGANLKFIPTILYEKISVEILFDIYNQLDAHLDFAVDRVPEVAYDLIIKTWINYVRSYCGSGLATRVYTMTEKVISDLFIKVIDSYKSKLERLKKQYKSFKKVFKNRKDCASLMLLLDGTLVQHHE